MHVPQLRAAIAFGLFMGLLTGCAGHSSINPAESLDERTGMTVGSLHKPIELVQSVEFSGTSGKRQSFAYLGPVEWDNMGNLRYGLWIHLAPGNDWRFDDIRSPQAVTLTLDDGAVVLSPIDAPALAHGPYQPVASWGQTAYFDLNVPMLQRMASSAKIELDFKVGGDPAVRFTANPDAHDVLNRYLHARGY